MVCSFKLLWTVSIILADSDIKVDALAKLQLEFEDGTEVRSPVRLFLFFSLIFLV
jgi:hypothetical protein